MPRKRYAGHRRHWNGVHPLPTYLVTVPVQSRRVHACMARLVQQYSLVRGKYHDPHITLCGPFVLSRGRDPLAILEKSGILGESGSFLQADLGDYLVLRGRKGWAVVVSASPARSLARLATGIRDFLSPYFHTCTWIDRIPGQRIFHISVSFGLQKCKAESMLRDLGRIPGCSPPHEGLCSLAGTTAVSYRIAIIRRGALLKGYDLPRSRWLSRSQCFSKDEQAATLEAFRKIAGYQLENAHFEPGDATFLISDLHLGHANIITYTSRPFPDVWTMDRVLIRNWNLRVKPGDTVYFLGDLRHGRNAMPAASYLPLLAGNIIRVAGNHDEDVPGIPRSLEIFHGSRHFLLVHDPADTPPGFEGFVVHGHHHNNQQEEFPFLAMPDKRVNVSAELLGYVPLSLDELVAIIGAAPVDGRFATLADAREFLSNGRRYVDSMSTVTRD